MSMIVILILLLLFAPGILGLIVALAAGIGVCLIPILVGAVFLIGYTSLDSDSKMVLFGLLALLLVGWIKENNKTSKDERKSVGNDQTEWWKNEEVCLPTQNDQSIPIKPWAGVKTLGGSSNREKRIFRDRNYKLPSEHNTPYIR